MGGWRSGGVILSETVQGTSTEKLIPKEVDMWGAEENDYGEKRGTSD